VKEVYFQHGRAFVSFDTQVIGHLLFLQDDVNVAGNELSDLLAVLRLNRVVLVFVVAEVLKC
jgi:hypothetical protein